ncbi:MAG TPA: metal ABC transporter substrate-binding protein [Verrucomicrobiae bacterium]
MKKLFVFLCLLIALNAQAALEVVATTPDLGSIAIAVGGDKVHVTNLARGTEDPHFVDAKPSFARILNKADVLIEGGADLEIGWLPPLVDGARNRKIIRGGEGRVDASEGVAMLEMPEGKVDRSQGDVHAAGNPHYLLNPDNGKIVAKHLAAHFSKVDPANAGVYSKNLSDFETALDAKTKEWSGSLQSFQGIKVVTYHKSFEYFAKRFGLVVAGQIEPKPGIEPSPTYISTLIPKMKEAGVRLVIVEPNRSKKTSEYVATNVGAKVLYLPILVGGNDQAGDYIKLLDYNVKSVAAALK